MKKAAGLSFAALQREAREIRASSSFRDTVQGLIDSGATNAGDTLGAREDLPYESRAEWDRIALDSVRGLLSDSASVPVTVFNWFARRITI